MSVNDDVMRGEQAKAILDNELFIEAWNTVEEGIIQRWKDCGVKDIDSQHELKLMLLVLSEVRRYIQFTAETGQMAKIQLDSDSRLTKIKRRIMN